MTPEILALRHLTGRVRSAAARLRGVAAGPPRVEGWGGAAAEAYDAASSSLRRRAEGVAAVLEELAGRLDAHTAAAQSLRHARLRLEVEADLAGPRGSAREQGRATRAALDRAAAAVDPVTGRSVEAHLLAYDPGAFDGDGAVVVAVGDPASADDVAVLVPGWGSDGASAPLHVGRALALHLAARRADPGDDNATVAWIGYDAPEGIGVLSERMAAAGGDRLTLAVDGLRADRAHDPAHLTVIGHSYGSTAVSLAATGPEGLAADDVVLVGSPGAGDAEVAADLGLAPGRVWVLRNSLDPVAALGVVGPVGLGEDPALDTWGAIRLRAESATPRTSWADWPLADHASYFQPGGEELDNLARVVAGRHEAVTTAPPLHDPGWGLAVDPELDRTFASTPRGPVR